MKTTVIIPAYNEETRIGAVLDTVNKCSLIDKVIVVDDGSHDLTADVSSSYGAEVIKLEHNLGKGGAMQEGIKKVKDTDLLAFVDADLVGFKAEHISMLIEPFLDDPELQMTVGKFTGGRARTDLAQKILPQISGQRVVRWGFLKTFPDLAHTKFGVELAINDFAKKSGVKTREILLPNVTQVMKEEKMGICKGLAARMNMYKDMLKHVKGTKKQ